MSVIAKARGYERGFPWWVLDMVTQYQEHSVDYIVALLAGYEDKAPAGVNVPTGTFYNKYFPATRWPCRRRCRTSASTTPTARRRRSTNTPRTFRLS